MKTSLKISVLLIIIWSFCVACQNDTNHKVRNIETFARLYGYARWFHPSDEARAIDWDKFAVLGVHKVEKIKSSKELRDTLFKLFSPIIQGLQIYQTGNPQKFNSDALLSPDPDAKPVAWQHYGVYLGMQHNIYRSARSRNGLDNNNGLVIKYFINTTRISGKEIKFSGYFKNKSPIDRGCVKIAAWPIVSMYNTENNKYDTVIESKDWEKYELEFTCPKGIFYLIYGFEVMGECEVYVDDFELYVNNQETWELVDALNMGFEHGKIEEGQMDDWNTFLAGYTFDISNDSPHSGKYSLKVSHTGKLFDQIPQFGEIIRESIGNHLTCVVPLTLLTNDTATYPKTDLSVLAQLKSEIENIKYEERFDLHLNLASVVITWNMLQHFFPYFDVIDTDWEKELGKTLKSAFANKQKKDFFVTLSQMIAKIEDGHGVVLGELMYHLPIQTEFIENKIVITASRHQALERGDIIKKMDGKSVMKVLDETEKTLFGSPQLRRYLASNVLGRKFAAGEKTNLVIKRNGKKQTVTISNSNNGGLAYYKPIDDRKYLSDKIVEIDSDIYYVNMANCTEDDFHQKIDILANAKAVIYDQRGGNQLNFFHITPYLIKDSVTSTWWNTPQTIYPNRKEVEYDISNWNIQPQQPFFKSRTIIINVPSVVSSGETMMGIIDHYHLATTVGETTAGCNGNVNQIALPCGYYVRWTGMKVMKHDGSQLYLKGFQPDYPVNKTIQAVKEGRDEYLEKALEIARR